MFRIVPVQRIRIGKDCGRLFKRDPMFLEIGDRLLDVPRKRIHVYTLIPPPAARTEGVDDSSGISRLFRLSGLSGLFSLSGSPIGQTNRTKQTKETR